MTRTVAWMACASAWLVLSGASGQEVPPGTHPSGETVLLTEKDEWRKQYTFSPPALEGDGGSPLPAPAGIHRVFPAPPPPSWIQPDFDDAQWLLASGRQFDHGIKDARATQSLRLEETSAYLRGSDPFFVPVGLICQRARFILADCRQVKKLSLSLTYRGGFAAYLNGKEVGRGHLGEGAIAPTTSGAAYPAEAFFYRQSLQAGKPRPLDPNDARCDQWALRERTFGPAEVPTDALRDGVNVLAIEFHRAAYPRQCRGQEQAGMAGLGLLELRGEGAQGPLAPPQGARGLKAMAVEVTRTVFDPARSGLNESPGPVRIVAARNGTFSGQVVVAHPQADEGAALEALSVKVSDLRQVGGAGVIPASAVKVRYGAANPFWPKALADLGLPVPTRWRRDAGAGGGTRFDVLLDAPPVGARAVAVWLSLRTPKDIPPGEYAGRVTISAKDAPAGAMPVEATVCDWTLPDLKDHAGVINIYQSPETLTGYYKVQPWSDAHWRLIEKSMELLGGMGNIGVFIPLLAESQMGNPESMVVWIRQADGSYRYDFGVFDRYVDTALKYHDRLRFVSLNVWGYEAATRTWKGPRDYAAFYGARVTVQDAATGTRQNVKLPEYGSPECEAMWRPLLEALRDRLKSRGLQDRILLGLAGDLGPEPPTAAMFHRILPDAGWIAESHRLNTSYVRDPQTKAGVPVRYNSICYGEDVPDPSARRMYGWQGRRDVTVMTFNRSGSNLLLMGYPPPWAFRTWMEATFACGRNGNGRVGGDYWHVGAKLLGEGEPGWGAIGGSGGTLFGRYLHSHADEAGLGRSCTDLFGPGPDGPVTTVRLENAREGNQEAEARAFLEKALLDRSRPLPAELARRCQDLLDERTHVLRLPRLGAPDIAPQGWQERARRLFDAAGEVAKALRGG